MSTPGKKVSINPVLTLQDSPLDRTNLNDTWRDVPGQDEVNDTWKDVIGEPESESDYDRPQRAKYYKKINVNNPQELGLEDNMTQKEIKDYYNQPKYPRNEEEKLAFNEARGPTNPILKKQNMIYRLVKDVILRNNNNNEAVVVYFYKRFIDKYFPIYEEWEERLARHESEPAYPVDDIPIDSDAYYMLNAFTEISKKTQMLANALANIVNANYESYHTRTHYTERLGRFTKAKFEMGGKRSKRVRKSNKKNKTNKKNTNNKKTKTNKKKFSRKTKTKTNKKK